MASQITIDMSGMGDKIVAAIHDATEKMVEAKIAEAVNTAMTAAKKENEEKRSELELDMAGMRTQILTNAKHLYILLSPRRDRPPGLDVVTFGVGTAVSAMVIHLDNLLDRHIFINGPDAPSEAKALQKLLAMTSEVMQKNWTGCGELEHGWNEVQGEGNSFYYSGTC